MAGFLKKNTDSENMQVLSLIICSIFIISESIDIPPSDISVSGNYTCDELKRWLGSEKHYSSGDKKKYLFSLLEESECVKNPVVLLNQLAFGWAADKGKKGAPWYSNNIGRKCESSDSLVVLMLSNFSIKHNFSHFLHAILR